MKIQLFKKGKTVEDKLTEQKEEQDRRVSCSIKINSTQFGVPEKFRKLLDSYNSLFERKCDDGKDSRKFSHALSFFSDYKVRSGEDKYTIYLYEGYFVKARNIEDKITALSKTRDKEIESVKNAYRQMSFRNFETPYSGTSLHKPDAPSTIHETTLTGVVKQIVDKYDPEIMKLCEDRNIEIEKANPSWQKDYIILKKASEADHFKYDCAYDSTEIGKKPRNFTREEYKYIMHAYRLIERKQQQYKI